jgi:hypothetical protein
MAGRSMQNAIQAADDVCWHIMVTIPFLPSNSPEPCGPRSPAGPQWTTCTGGHTRHDLRQKELDLQPMANQHARHNASEHDA